MDRYALRRPLRARRNRLMLSVDGADRYYMFLLVERSVDHLPCRITVLDRNALWGFSVAQRIARRVPSMTYRKYVMDPMFQHQ
jgi:hypothetical protein